MTQLNYRVLLKEKTDLLVDYKRVTELVQTSLNQKNSSELTVHMKARARLINKINSIDRALMPQGAYIDRRTGGDGEKQAIDAMFKEMEDLLDGIRSIEKECFHSAKMELEAIKSDILAARQHRKRTKGYHYAAAIPARYVDTRIK